MGIRYDKSVGNQQHEQLNWIRQLFRTAGTYKGAIIFYRKVQGPFVGRGGEFWVVLGGGGKICINSKRGAEFFPWVQADNSLNSPIVHKA